MSKLLSLRGTFSLSDAELANTRIFEYEANDLTKGWEVVDAYIWPKDTRAITGAAHGHLQLCASLLTDNARYTDFADACNAADNRQIAWLQSGYLMRDISSDDFLSNGSNPPNPAKFTIDPQHIAVNGLWIQAYATSDSTTNPTREWNYMVVLKPKKLDPKETILHFIKNVAQDIVN